MPLSNQPFTGTMTDGMAQTPVTVLAGPSRPPQDRRSQWRLQDCSRAARQWFRHCSEKKIPGALSRPWRPV